MSHAFAARGARQTAVLAAIIGLHFAVFLVVAGGLIPPNTFRPVERMKVRLLPKPVETEPTAVPPASGPRLDNEPYFYPEPHIPIPEFDKQEPRADTVFEGEVGSGAGAGPVAEIIPPSLRTRPASVAAAINACDPAASRRMNEEGTVVALVTIGAGGSAVNWSVAQSSGFARLDAAIDCVLRKLDFVAGRRDGQAVSMEARLPIVFRLD